MYEQLYNQMDHINNTVYVIYKQRVTELFVPNFFLLNIIKFFFFKYYYFILALPLICLFIQLYLKLKSAVKIKMLF